MPYLRVMSVIRIKNSIRAISGAYKDLNKCGVRQYFAISVLLMYLFSVLEDIVALHVRDIVVDRKDDGDDGVLVRYSEFLKYARKFGLLTGVSSNTLKLVVDIRNDIAHSFRKANRMFSKILKDVPATDCAKLFKNAFNSIDMDAETRLICNELLYDLFRRDGLQLSEEFERWMSVENAVLREEIKNAANNVSTC